MVGVSARPTPHTNGKPSAPTAAIDTRPRRQRNWKRIGIGLAVFFGCGLAGLMASLAAGDKVPLLVVVRPVAAGDAIEDGDLGVASGSVHPAFRAIPASDKASIVGEPAAVNLVPGLLSRSHVASGPPFGEGQAVVGLLLKHGQMPVELEVGSTVRVVASADATVGSDDSSSGVLVERAVVKRVASDDDHSGGRRVDVVVPLESVDAVTAAAAAGNVSVALVGGL